MPEKEANIREWFNSLYHNTSDAIVMLDKEGNIVAINDVFTEKFKYTLAEIEGRDIDEVLKVAEKPGSFDKSMTEQVLAGEPRQKEVTRYDKAGNPREYRLKTAPIYVDDEVVGAYAIYVDITARKEALKKLETSRELYRTMFASAPIGMMLIDEEGIILEANEAIAKITGYSLEELEGSYVFERPTPPEYKKQAKENIKQILKGQDIDFKAKSINKEGELLFYRLKETRITLPNGRPGILSMQTDITEIKEKEQKLEEQKAVFEKLHQLALDLSQLESGQEIINTSLAAVKNILDQDVCYYLARGDRGEFNLQGSCFELASEEMQSIVKWSLQDLAHRVYNNRESWNIADLNEDNLNRDSRGDKLSYKLLSQEFRYRSLIAVPVGDHGVFVGCSQTKEAFSGEVKKLLELLFLHTTASLDRVKSQKKLRYKTFHDEMTGLYNRRFFEEELARLDSKRQLPLSLVMIDINGLKIINDSLGHKKGDELIIKTANLLKRNTRQEDILARFGGDEFVILLPRTTKEAAREIIKRINLCCQEESDEGLPISLGIGLASKDAPEQDIKEILTAADNKMYQDKLVNSRSQKNKIVQSLLDTLGAKSDETREHALRMTTLAHRLGRKIGISDTSLNRLSLLATLHDIGKTTIPEEILIKPEKLSAEEWQLMQEHPERGYKIVSATEEFAVIAEEVLSHHEKWDGSGYPRGLKKDEIPLLARIIAIVDAFDVMTHNRPYSRAITREAALKEIENCTGSQFDPELAKIFLEVVGTD